MIKEIWLLDLDYKNECVQICSSGMTVFTSKKDGISVGYSNQDRLNRFRLISSAPELLRALKLANKIINDKNPKEWWNYEFNDLFKKAINKINGDGNISKPNHCRATYEWNEKHIEDYHIKVNETIKYKL